MNPSATNIIELETEPNATSPVTPMMRQYFAIKEAHPDCLLFYRMGDFYELFFDDARQASEALDIALTHRGKLNGQDVPMCGVPHHSSEYYLHKLIKKGFKVAICEQMEDPKEAKKRGAKSVVKREVVRIVTSGTITEETLLDTRSANYLAALVDIRGEAALAWLDISTGEFCVASVDAASLSSELARIAPRELLLPEKLWQEGEYAKGLAEWRSVLTPHAASFFDAAKGKRKLLESYTLASLDGVGEFSASETAACGALLDYVELTQKGKFPRLNFPRKLGLQHYMAIDAATRRNLELTHTMTGEYQGSLLHTIDRTVSGAGARLLHAHISAPLLDTQVIRARLEAVEFFVEREGLRLYLRDALKSVPDMERALSRLALNRGGPRDIAAIREGLKAAMRVSELLEHAGVEFPGQVLACRAQLGTHDTLLIHLNEALEDVVPVLARDGGFVRGGYNPRLDDYRQAQTDSNGLKEQLRTKYIAETKISSLKIKDNNILGFFIEITPQHADKIPEYFTHRQTMGGALRYTTQELKELEHRIINARGYTLELELEIFRQLAEEVLGQGDPIMLTAQALAQLDVHSALAELAAECNYCRPVVYPSFSSPLEGEAGRGVGSTHSSSGVRGENPSPQPSPSRGEGVRAFRIVGGRHSVVERYITESFIRNDIDLSGDGRLWLLTGPNMAGKSTFLRQNALIAILAQMGSFVPAESASIGVVDRVFSRVGASDNLARGQSTFMVEMVETAAILNQATAQSLVILDEIGRGTATYDGLSIAWAVVEYLHDKVQCRGLFATHYHELTTLSSRLSHLACHTMKVKEWKGDVVFLHEVAEGVADRSYGIHVGKLAGLPPVVLARAEQVLSTLQQNEAGSAMTRLSEDLPLFGALQEREAEYIHAVPTRIEGLIKEKDIDSLSPREALEFLYTLKDNL